MGRRHRRRRLRAAAPPAAARASSAASTLATRDRLATFVEEFAPQVVAHFGVYEPASRMTPASAGERTEACTNATLSAASRDRCARVRRAPQRARGVRPSDRRASRCPTRTPCPRPRRRTARSLARRSRPRRKGVALRLGVPVGALRYAPVRRVARAEPARPAAAACRSCRSARFSDPPFSLLHPDDAARAMVAAIEHRIDGPCNVVGPGAATPVAGRAPRRPRAAARSPPGLWGAGRARVRGRGRRARAARRRSDPARLHRRRQPGARRARASRDLVPTQDVLRELFDWADVVAIARAGEQAA